MTPLLSSRQTSALLWASPARMSPKALRTCCSSTTTSPPLKLPSKKAAASAVASCSRSMVRAAADIAKVDQAVAEAKEVVERTGFQRRSDDEKQRFVDATDSEYVLVPTVTIEASGVTVDVPVYPAIVFQTRELKEEFLAVMAARFPGEILGDKYISGDVLAKALGITLKARRPTWPKGKGPDKKLLTLR